MATISNRLSRNRGNGNAAHTASLDSFYHLSNQRLDEKVCNGLACFVARQLNPLRWQQATTQDPRVYCLGKCYASPSSALEDRRPDIAIHARQAIILPRLAHGGARSLQAYLATGGYQALEIALGKSPEELIQMVEASGLRGRGGAGFATGRKWRAVFAQSAPQKYVIANADEGDPGVFIDRFIMEDDPHALLEAMTIAAYAVGASQGYIYLRNEYPQALSTLQSAIEEAQRAQLLGDGILHRDFSFTIQIVIGQGSYVCGEETAMLNSIEGRRPEVRTRPPYPTQHGLFDKPTLVNNVETLASIPWIVANGSAAYHRLGFANSRGTKVIALNSLFQHPGLYEIEFGMALRDIVENLGGGLRTGELKGVIIGGPLAGIIPPELFDTRFGFEEMHSLGASVGHGGVVAFTRQTSIAELIHQVFAFAAYESCGKCTPCRAGSSRVEQIFTGILDNGHGSTQDRDEFAAIIKALAQTSLCGLGSGLAEFAESAVRYYGKELELCFT